MKAFAAYVLDTALDAQAGSPNAARCPPERPKSNLLAAEVLLDSPLPGYADSLIGDPHQIARPGGLTGDMDEASNDPRLLPMSMAMAPVSEQRWLAIAGFGMLAGLAIYRAAHAFNSEAASGFAADLSRGYAVLVASVLVAVTIAAARRPTSAQPATSVLAYVATAVAVGLLYFIEAPTHATASGSVIAGLALAFAAGVWMLASVVALGRCFGLLPEARGVVVRGPYRLVRHPIYLGEITAVLGLSIASLSLRNSLVLAGFVVAQVIRMHLEEAALLHQFPAYARYAAGRPRLIPRPWRNQKSPSRVLPSDAS